MFLNVAELCVCDIDIFFCSLSSSLSVMPNCLGYTASTVSGNRYFQREADKGHRYLSEILIPMVRKAREDDHDFKIGMKVATRTIESE